MTALPGDGVFRRAFFCRAAKLRSIRRAAESYGLSGEDALGLLSELEAETGGALFERTNRGSFLTGRGEQLYGAWRDAAETLESLSGGGSAGHSLTRTYSITAPVTTGAFLVAPAAAEAARKNPGAFFDLRFTSGSFHPLWDGADLRIGHGPYRLEEVETFRIGKVRRIVVASPSYLETHPGVSKPDDLVRPEVFGARDAVETGTVVFTKGKKRSAISFHPAVAIRNHLASLECALSGAGIAILVPLFLARRPIKEGRLVRLLPEWSLPPLPIRAFTARGRTPGPVLDVIRELRERFRADPAFELDEKERE